MSAAEPKWVRGYALDPRSLAVSRVLYCAYLLLFVDLSQFAFVAELPAALWRPPPGLMMLWPRPPSAAFTLGLIAAIEVLAVLVAVGWRTRGTSWALSGAVFVLAGLTTCSGKIDHNIFLWLTPLFVGGQWGRAWSLDAAEGRTDPTVDPLASAALAVLIGFCMLSAGLPKLFGGWLNPDHQATRAHFLRNTYLFERSGGLAPQIAQLSSKVFWELGDWVTVIWELGFLATVRWPRLFRWMLVSAIGFHTAVLLAFNIGFSANLVAYAVLAPWCDGWTPSRGPSRRRWMLPVALAAGLGFAVAPSPARWLGEIGGYPQLPSALAFGLAAVMLGLWSVGRGWRAQERS